MKGRAAMIASTFTQRLRHSPRQRRENGSARSPSAAVKSVNRPRAPRRRVMR
jgi:hypothetical protein